jgi:hypothetical protein
MQSIPFIPNESFDFVVCKEISNSPSSKSCPVCRRNFTTMKIIKSVKKVCSVCKRTICKNCSRRKISKQRLRICKDCYLESLKDYYLAKSVKIITETLKKEDIQINLKKIILEECNTNYNNLLLSLEALKKSLVTDFSSVESKLESKRGVMEAESYKCNQIRMDVLNKESKMTNYDKICNELHEEINRVSQINQVKKKILNDLKEELSVVQDESSYLSIFIEKKAAMNIYTGGDQSIFEIVKKIKSRMSVHGKETGSLYKEKENLEADLEKLDLEIKSYVKKTSSQFSGNFDHLKGIKSQDELSVVVETEKKTNENSKFANSVIKNLKKAQKSAGLNNRKPKSSCEIF